MDVWVQFWLGMKIAIALTGKGTYIGVGLDEERGSDKIRPLARIEGCFTKSRSLF